LSGYFAIADYEEKFKKQYETALLRVGQLREIGMPEEEIIQPMMSEKSFIW
jgi:hypothetical protein